MVCSLIICFAPCSQWQGDIFSGGRGCHSLLPFLLATDNLVVMLFAVPFYTVLPAAGRHFDSGDRGCKYLDPVSWPLVYRVNLDRDM